MLGPLSILVGKKTHRRLSRGFLFAKQDNQSKQDHHEDIDKFFPEH